MARRHGEFRAALADRRHDIDDALVDGDRLVARRRYEGTCTGRLGGVEPGGARVTVGVTSIDRFGDGRLVDHTGQLDRQGMLEQIGATSGY